MFKITEQLMHEKFCTIRETAGILRVSEIRIRQLCYKERFKGAFNFGGTWLIPKESVIKFERKTGGRRKVLEGQKVGE